MAAEEGRFQLFPEDGGVLETSRGFTGKARAQYADGSVFEGNYVKGRREGFGVYTHASGDKFEGEYSNDKRHGTGRMEFADGGFFHGTFSEGRVEGRGTRRFKNGDVYFGDWKNGEFHGRGTYTFAQGKHRLSGEWEFGELKEGAWSWADGRRYEGSFSKNKPQGEGRWLFPQGTELRGVYRQRALPADEDAGEGASATRIELSWKTAETLAAAPPAQS